MRLVVSGEPEEREIAEQLARTALRGFFEDEDAFGKMKSPRRKRAIEAVHAWLSVRVYKEENREGDL